jgi:transcriptional regulator with GAF, ATPase, and Fis domain
VPLPIVQSGERDAAAADQDGLVPLARTLLRRSSERWGAGFGPHIVGRHPRLSTALERVASFARSDSPVLITGETGTGKELFAKALFLLSPRWQRPFLTVNCAQYQDSQLIASELFGHKRGSFTGAICDHQGVFEAAESGVVFLDEVGELGPQAQAMLLRLLSESEIVPVGEARSRHVNVRTIVATNRNLKEMVEAGRFRADLYYRLRYLQLQIPAVRDRGEDWRLIVEHYLHALSSATHQHKEFSEEALALLRNHHWPGNVREIRGLVDTGFHISLGPIIEPKDFLESLEEEASRTQQLVAVPLTRTAPALLGQLLACKGNFWQLVHQPYLDRDLNRAEVKEIVSGGLSQTGGSYKKLLPLFGMAETDYLRFMDFLRHHRLKPPERRSAFS